MAGECLSHRPWSTTTLHQRDCFTCLPYSLLSIVNMSDQVDGSRSTSSIVTEPEDYPRSTTPQSPPRTSQPYTSASPLLKLPLELRQHIYSLVFHDNPTIDDPCWGTWLEKGCQCGGGLSATNCQLYSEVRAMVYRYRRFAFSTPERALFFLTQAGENRVRYIGSFAINWEQKPRSLRKIIDHLTVCTCLHTLCLEACHVRLILISPTSWARYGFLFGKGNSGL